MNVIGGGLESYLHRQAREQAINRIAEARESADKLIEQARIEAEQAQQTIASQSERRIDAKRRQRLAQAHQRAQQIHLRGRQDVLDRVFSEAEVRLKNLAPQRRIDSLRHLIANAVEQLGSDEIEVRVGSGDLDLLDQFTQAEIAQQLKKMHGVRDVHFADEAAPIWGGAIVTEAGGHRFVDNSYNARLALARNRLRDQVYYRLTDAEPSGNGEEQPK